MRIAERLTVSTVAAVAAMTIHGSPSIAAVPIPGVPMYCIREHMPRSICSMRARVLPVLCPLG